MREGERDYTFMESGRGGGGMSEGGREREGYMEEVKLWRVGEKESMDRGKNEGGRERERERERWVWLGTLILLRQDYQHRCY